ncbi:MAG: XdhC family protein [Syntrophorhabdaceae bacterium]|nr:XdhC family protein [Syntrophorhabdales bacterium]MBP9561261.1 XdhC family protein [Syntrophorhabdaceae bacterium]
MNIYRIIEEYLNMGKKGIIATVIKRIGSAPRDIGAKMFIGEDKKIYGTVGGGRLENDAFEEAIKLMGKDMTRVLHIRMNATDVADDGMLCGGDVDILLEPAEERYMELYRSAGISIDKGKKAFIITRFKDNRLSKTFIGHYNSIIGDPITETESGYLQRYMEERNPQLINDTTVIEPLIRYSPLYIFGAGHVSQYLSKIAKIVEFYTVIIDDRPEFANKERFLDADEIIVDSFEDVLERLQFTGSEYVVIVTRGHQYDVFVLEKVLKKDFRYVGMIGSRRKVKIIMEYLREKGFNEDIIKRVHAPIGLEINAETPQEIAVSIVAELIKERAKG